MKNRTLTKLAVSAFIGCIVGLCIGYTPGTTPHFNSLTLDSGSLCISNSSANGIYYANASQLLTTTQALTWNPGKPQLIIGTNAHSPEGILSISSTPIPTNKPVISAFQSWNGSGVTFTSIVVRIIDTLSSASSKLITADVGDSNGTTNMFSVDKYGTLNTVQYNAATGNVATLVLTNPLSLSAIGDLTLSNLANNPYKGYTNPVATAAWATLVTPSTTNVYLDLTTTNNFNVLALTNFTMTFTNLVAGRAGDIIIQQDTNGTRTLNLVLAGGGTVTTPQSVTPTLTTNASATDWFRYIVDSTGTNVFLTPGERRTVNVTTNLVFALGTRYTNGPTRLMPAASWTLNAAAAGTAKVTLYVEHVTSFTNRLSVSAGPLASLVTVEPLAGLIVGPYEIYRFEDETSGAGASVAVVANTCSRQEF